MLRTLPITTQEVLEILDKPKYHPHGLPVSLQDQVFLYCRMNPFSTNVYAVAHAEETGFFVAKWDADRNKLTAFWTAGSFEEAVDSLFECVTASDNPKKNVRDA